MSRGRKRALQVSVDVILIVCVFALSMWLKTESIDFAYNPKVWIAIALVIPVSLACFVRLGFYRAVLRYIAGRALGAIMAGSIFSAVILSIFSTLLDAPIPNSVPLIYLMAMFLTVGGIRFGFREVYNFGHNRQKQRVAVYGAGAAGRQLLQVLHQRSDYVPVAFIDDSTAAQGTLVGGLMVHSPAQIDQLIHNIGVSVVLLAMPSISNLRRTEILKSIEGYPLSIQSVPGLDDIMTGRARIDQIKELGIEDLLGPRAGAAAPRADECEYY